MTNFVTREITRIPCREQDGVFVEPCPFGVIYNPALDDVVEYTSESKGCCNLPEIGSVAGAGSFTCKSCTYHVQILDGDVICAHPVRMTGDE